MKKRKGMKSLVAIMISVLLVLQCAGPIFAAEEIIEETSKVSEEVMDKTAKEVKEEATEEKAETTEAKEEEKTEAEEEKAEVKEEAKSEEKEASKEEVKKEVKAVKGTKSVKEAKETSEPCTITYVMDKEYFDVYSFNKGPADAKTYTEEKNRITGFGAFYKDRETNKYMFDVTMTLLNDAVGTLNGKKVTFPAGTIVSVRSERYDGTFEAKVNYSTEGEGKGFGYTTFDEGQNIRILVTPYYTIKYSVNFEAGENGKLEGQTAFEDINKGSEFKNVVKVPTPVAEEGYEFSHWEEGLPEEGHRVRSNETYKAVFEAKKAAEPVVPEEPKDENNTPAPDDEEFITPDDENNTNGEDVVVTTTTTTVKTTTVERNNDGASVGTSAANTGNAQPAAAANNNTAVNNNVAINDNQTPLASGANAGEATTINDNETPLANAEQTNAGSFALVNILLAVLSIISAMVMGLKGMRREGKMSMTAAGIVLAIVSVAVFFLTQDLSGNMVIADMFTVVMAVIAVVQIAVGCMMNREEAKENR
ncbi:hypothetical protein ANASTE_01181 [Anaerofustis stercorihominis DSM 17244]|uniref:Repeat protein n=3 Tax=Anaerofustis stercorihominis TaxID=214853 RepID=B1CB32_9FIRM|nr:hypothetical protein [Anaerofustis stercorihominis]EDS71479.1 hypothetical protein ANASTE_01181 [Anaerofustis stercorihominis DSM 17244]